MSQADKIRTKLLLQWDKLSKKLHPKPNYKEITNAEVQLALYQLATCQDVKNEFGDDQLDWLTEAMTQLDKREMWMIKAHYFEGISLRQISEDCHKSHDWAAQTMPKIIDKLKGVK